MRSTWCTFCLVWLFSLAVSPALAEYRLQAGDTVEISVAQQTNLNRQAVIAPDGRLSLPLAGHLQAEGLTVEELEAALVERLSSFFKDKLNLTVMLLPNPQHLPTVFVVGDVNTPRSLPLQAGHDRSACGQRLRRLVPVSAACGRPRSCPGR